MLSTSHHPQSFIPEERLESIPPGIGIGGLKYDEGKQITRIWARVGREMG